MKNLSKHDEKIFYEAFKYYKLKYKISLNNLLLKIFDNYKPIFVGKCLKRTKNNNNLETKPLVP